jgi:putative ATP-dependent endonuclease of OLD family
LIEGDAEEILMPLLVKRVFGISLDELGISLINIGSTGFENVAQIFHNDRIRRNCSVVTDLDKAICVTTILAGDTEELKEYKKKVAASEKSGAARKLILDTYVSGNAFLKVCYADYTFEVDFIIAGNEPEVIQTIDDVYSDPTTKAAAKKEIESDDVDVFGKRVLTMARNKGKGWYALVLGKYITYQTYIPDYIFDAILFSKSSINKNIIISILEYRISKHSKSKTPPDFSALKIELVRFKRDEINLKDLIKAVETVIKGDQIIYFLKGL